MKKNNQDKEQVKKSLVISYLTLRKAVGILGISFPAVLLVGSCVAGGCEEIQNSISAYYHTGMRNIFVGVLCAVALFLFSYRGYEKIDNIAGDLACLFALGVAFLPCTVDSPLPPCNCHSSIGNELAGNLHLVSASLFFIVLACFSLFLFTKSKSKKKLTAQKKKRNKIYRTCGYIMLGSILAIALYFLFLNKHFPMLRSLKPVFWLESTALWAFGVSWLIKGEVIFRDTVKKKK